ncbi:MAG: chemotaxis protein CheB, partial [Gemmataceae bacterium]
MTRETESAPDPSPEPAPRPPSYIVGVGASAGGLEALERFFSNSPANTGMAFVVVQHLSPDFKSLMNELLDRWTSMAIHRVENGMRIDPDAIYLIPPKKDMIVSEGHLLLTDRDPTQIPSLPIDRFFRSLAQDAGERAIGVILSGTGSDGSQGVRYLREAGGLVVVQAAETAKFDGMPNSAVQTGVADLILAPEEMPAALARYASRASRSEFDLQENKPPQDRGWDALFRMFRERFSIDFSVYRSGTIVRRTERRMLMAGVQDLDEYVRRLNEDPEEGNQLYRDLLINVTRFFRDPEAFDRIEADVLPALLDRLADGGELRVWVAGCATGEEAYSLAILFQEQLASRPGKSVKLFATDLHKQSLDVASAGLYHEASLA